MKTTTIALLAAAALLPAVALAQTPPAPTAPVAPGAPTAPAPAAPPERGDKPPKVPVTFLGVETSELPNVVADQLGLPKGFGLVVEYVVPEGPAAAAGVQQNDILKMFNDQILTERDQLSKLIRSYPEGTTVTLTILRKGAETKLTARLGKREVSQRRGHGSHGGHWGPNLGDLGTDMEKLTEDLGKLQFAGVDEDKIREDVRRAQREAAREGREAAREAREAAREAARDARRAARDFRFSYGEDGRLKTTRIDMDKAQIVYHDAQGELKIEKVHGKKLLTAKDPQGRLVFSGPVETQEELAKLPTDVRQRYEQLEQKDIPAVTPPTPPTPTADADEEDEDAEDDSRDEAADVLKVSGEKPKAIPYRRFGINTILI